MNCLPIYPIKTLAGVLQSGADCCNLQTACNLESLYINKLRQNADCGAQIAELSAIWKISIQNNKLKENKIALQPPTPYGGSSEPHAYAGGSLPAFCNLTQSTSPLTQMTKDGTYE